METKYLRINPADNVAVAIVNLPAGEHLSVDGIEITLNEDIPAGHKFALKDFAEGENVIKYGYPIGHARMAKKQGDWMNETNIKTNLAGLLEYTYHPTQVTLDIPHKNLTFKGYRRKNGDVGVRNEIWIIPTVGCVNGIIGQLAEGLRRETEGKGVDAIVAFPHNYGCSQLGDDHENTKKILRDMVLHPNAGAVLIVGLGCENNQPDVFREFLGDYDQDRVKFMVTQKVGDEYEEGMDILRDLYAKASKDERTEVPLSELRVGLKCGGSDGFSGITANPLLGMFSDFLIAQGGTSVLTEVPEMFGAETILMNRCENKDLFEQTVHLINDFKEYFLSHGEPVGENPSPGNKAGGISTLEEKVVFLVNHVVDQLNENKALMRFISKNLSWAVFSHIRISNMGNIKCMDIFDEILGESNRKFRQKELMIYMIVELVSASCYSVILYGTPCSLEELKAELDKTICGLLKQFEVE